MALTREMLVDSSGCYIQHTAYNIKYRAVIPWECPTICKLANNDDESEGAFIFLLILILPSQVQYILQHPWKILGSHFPPGKVPKWSQLIIWRKILKSV
jgi:hypothetical protein